MKVLIEYTHKDGTQFRLCDRGTIFNVQMKAADAIDWGTVRAWSQRVKVAHIVYFHKLIKTLSHTKIKALRRNINSHFVVK